MANDTRLSEPRGLGRFLFDLLNPIPLGFFVATLIFDIAYAQTYNWMWGSASAWLVTIGLLFVVIPRIINLWHVWSGHYPHWPWAGKGVFFLYALGVIAGIFNAFVHSRDAYAVVPTNMILSVITVALVLLAHLIVGLRTGSHRLN